MARLQDFSSVCCELNTEELNKGSLQEFNKENLVSVIRKKLPETDWSHAKMCVLINYVHNRIDVLDSLDYESLQTDWNDHHDPVFVKLMIERLCDALQTISKSAFRKIRNLRPTPFSKAPVQKRENDCAFFVMKFLEFFDGEELVLCTNIIPTSFGVRRSTIHCSMN